MCGAGGVRFHLEFSRWCRVHRPTVTAKPFHLVRDPAIRHGRHEITILTTPRTQSNSEAAAHAKKQGSIVRTPSCEAKHPAKHVALARGATTAVNTHKNGAQNGTEVG